MSHDPMVIQLNGKGGVVPPPPRPPLVVVPWRGLWYAFVGAVVVGLLSIIGVLGYTYFTSHQAQIASDETAELVSNVGRIMLLPTDEQPTVATVTNLESLKNQVFFKNARLGDRVLMYPKNKKAILYSPTEKRIIEVAPITFDENL